MAKHRRFIRLDNAGQVIWDATYTRESEDWSDLPDDGASAPAGMIEILADPQALNGRLGRHVRNQDGSFTAPAAQPRTVTVDVFFELFTRAERNTMRQLARGDAMAEPAVAPDDDIADLVQQLELKAGVSPVNLDSPKLAAALDLLIARSIIDAARKTRIIAGLSPL